MRKLVLIAVVGVVATLGIVAGALAGGGYGGGYGDTTATQSTQSTSGTTSSTSGTETYSFKATLNAAAEVPKPKGAPAGAGGSFTAKSTETKTKTTIHWVLKFHGLSGKATAAHIHLGKKGKAGNVVVPLCGPCKASQSGTVKISSAIESALEKGATYVNVHTLKNAAGEIRGQIKLTGK